MKLGLYKAYDHVFSFPYPILENENFTKLSLLQEISHTSRPTLLTDILEANYSTRLTIIKDTIEELFADYEHEMELRTTNITGLAEHLVREVDKLREKLNAFQLESKIDWRFYMYVTLFLFIHLYHWNYVENIARTNKGKDMTNLIVLELINK